MFSKKQQRKIINQRFRNITLHLLAFCAANDNEELHQLRVETKRLRALGRFIDDNTDKKHFAELLQPVKSMFAQAARIRSAHIHLKVTKGIAGKKFKTEQQKIQVEEWKKFAAKQNTFITQLEKTEKQLESYVAPIKQKATLKWNKKQVKKAAGRLQKGALYFHEGRKVIKRMLYIGELRISPPMLNIPYLKHTEDIIGKWHDLKETVILLKKNHPKGKRAIQALNTQKEKLSKTIKEHALLFADYATKK